MPPPWKPLRYPPARPWRYVAAATVIGFVFGGTLLLSGSYKTAALATLIAVVIGLTDVFFMRAPAD